MARLLLIAGSETTTNLICLGVRQLARDKELADALRRDPEMIRSFTEELLRFDGPTTAVLRLLKEDVTLHGVTLKRGERVVLFLGSANRDEEQFEDPDRFDMTRSNAHLGFGKGNHFCIGATLARLEFRVVVEEMLKRYSDLRIGERGFEQSAMILQVFRRFDLETTLA